MDSPFLGLCAANARATWDARQGKRKPRVRWSELRPNLQQLLIELGQQDLNPYQRSRINPLGQPWRKLQQLGLLFLGTDDVARITGLGREVLHSRKPWRKRRPTIRKRKGRHRHGP